MNNLNLPTSPSDMSTPATNPLLYYDPPYERPVEDEFAWHLVKYLQQGCRLQYQHRVPTAVATFWVAFVVEQQQTNEEKPRRIGFELGSLNEDVADADRVRHLRQRDALVIGESQIDALYRLRACDLLHRLHDVLYLVAQHEQALFSKRGHINLRTLASDTVHGFTPHESPRDIIHIVYATEQPKGLIASLFAPDQAPELIMRRLDRSVPERWMRDYDEAIASYQGRTKDTNWLRSA